LKSAKRVRAKSTDIIMSRIKARKKVSAKKAKAASLKAKAKHTLHLSINAETERLIIRWPSACEGLREELTEEVCGISGSISYLYDGTYKKVAPLDIVGATKILDLVLPYKKMGVLKVNADVDFKAWYRHRYEIEQGRKEAQSILEVDPSKVKTIFEEFDIPLFWWQTVGFEFLDVSTKDGLGALLTDRVGLGKTYTATAHVVKGGHKALVVVPSALRQNWVVKPKHLYPALTTYVVEGGKFPLDAHKADMIIVSYKMLERHHIFIHLMELVGSQNRILLLDEAHYIKNLDSSRTQSCLHLADRAKHCIPITATPLVNRARELYPLLKATRRSWTSCSQRQFIKTYESEKGEKEIGERLKGIMIRRHGEDVRKDMPKSEIGEMYIELTNRAEYDLAEKDFVSWLLGKGSSDQMTIDERGLALKKLNALRQLAVTGKIGPVTELINSALEGGEQVVAFSSYNAPLRKVTRSLSTKSGTDVRGHKWKGAGLIIGAVTQKRRLRYIEEFNKGKMGLLGIGIKCAVGFDVPSACIGYFLDLPWTPADFEQSMGRLVRIGQERDCQFFKCLAANTIDQRMDEIMFAKAHSFMRAIDDHRAVDRITPTNSNISSGGGMLEQIIDSYIMDAVAKG
jgi:SWI/SNF-related matrix-associated actin-dependent regulator of chromatin subfamily A-like protein 1